MLSSSSDFEHFGKSSIWRDISEEIDVWIKQIHEAMEDPEIEDKTWRRLQGNIESLRKVKLIPSVITENLRQEEEDRNE